MEETFYLRSSHTSEDTAGPPRQREGHMLPIIPKIKKVSNSKALNILGMGGDLDDKKKEGN